MKKRKHYMRNLLFFIILVILFFVTMKGTAMVLDMGKSSNELIRLEQGEETYQISLKSKSGILISVDDSTILMEKNSEDKIYPASLTKIMTALLLIENRGLNERVEIPQEIFSQIYASHASVAGFQPGDEVRVKDLLYGIMLPSGADASLTAVNFVAESEEAFVALMNEKARDLGMSHTHFTNATGVHNPNHYSTVKDIAVLLCYALKEEAFYAAFTAQNYTASHGLSLQSILFQTMNQNRIFSPYILGGKTGYTSKAGLCLGSCAKINGELYLLITGDARGNHETPPYHILDAVTVYDTVANR